MPSIQPRLEIAVHRTSTSPGHSSSQSDSPLSPENHTDGLRISELKSYDNYSPGKGCDVRSAVDDSVSHCSSSALGNEGLFPSSANAVEINQVKKGRVDAVQQSAPDQLSLCAENSSLPSWTSGLFDHDRTHESVPLSFPDQVSSDSPPCPSAPPIIGAFDWMPDLVDRRYPQSCASLPPSPAHSHPHTPSQRPSTWPSYSLNCDLSSVLAPSYHFSHQMELPNAIGDEQITLGPQFQTIDWI